jgi:hypothetical protein
MSMVVVHELPSLSLLQQDEEGPARVIADRHAVFWKIVRKLSLPKLEVKARLKIEPEQAVA